MIKNEDILLRIVSEERRYERNSLLQSPGFRYTGVVSPWVLRALYRSHYFLHRAAFVHDLAAEHIVKLPLSECQAQVVAACILVALFNLLDGLYALMDSGVICFQIIVTVPG